MKVSMELADNLEHMVVNPVLSASEKVLLHIMAIEAGVTSGKYDPSVEVVRVRLTTTDLALRMNNSYPKTSQDLSRLVTFGLVRRSGGHNSHMELVVRGPWPMLGYVYLPEQGFFASPFTTRSEVSKMDNDIAKVWRKAVLNGHLVNGTNVSSALFALLATGGKSIDLDIEDMREVLSSKAQP